MNTHVVPPLGGKWSSGNRLKAELRTLLASAFLILIAAPIFGADVLPNYGPLAGMLEDFVPRELRDKGIPGVAIAIFDDQTLVWSRGWGVARPDKISSEDDNVKGAPMTAKTIIRAGSVSKLFTSVLVMREVEAGRLDLDAPITKYLPDSKPTNRFATPITLREILAHRAGLVREPPYGNYFENDQDSLSKMVDSLNQTEIVYEPGTRTKYSNAGVATAGYIASRSAETGFPRLARKSVFKPAGMDDSEFFIDGRFRKNMAEGLMWTLHGEKFKAPVFEWGMSPAASLTTTVVDLAKFGMTLIADANGAHKLLKKQTLEEMWKPAFVAPNEKRGFGIGFSMSELEGHRRAGHNGAVYGFATDFSLLPDEKIGVAVVVTKDFGNTVASRIANNTLRAMLAVRAGKPVEKISTNQTVPKDIARTWEGKFSAGEKSVELLNFDRTFSILRDRMPAALRWDGTNFITDGLTGYGTVIQLGENTNELRVANETYRRERQPLPPAAPQGWRSLIGEYGWDYDVLYIFENDGKLWSLIEWFEFAPIEEIAPDIFKFPDSGSYAGEKLVFKRDDEGRVKEVIAANVRFKRRKIGPEDGVGQARIRPIKPVNQLMKQAEQAHPPTEKGELKQADLVELTALDPTITLEIRYATTNNFLGSSFYAEPKAFMQRPAAEAVARVNARLRPLGYGLRIFDAYRPWAVTKVFWDATTEAQHEFVADPSKGSRHNRGCAVDLTLYDLATGASIEMTGTYDETTDRSYPTYPGGTSRQRWHRDLLRRMMESEGFSVYYTEWWHFDFNGWRGYPILNIPFAKIQNH
jgi:CubicO group peptidase (beta-lactamase class C family)/D-alanyl-D-alanine dipeptidase